MKKSNATLLVTLGSIVIVVGGLVWLARRAETGADGQYDQLAQCLTEKGAKFYGASWCPHCAEQKRLFGTSMKSIDYVECAVPGDNSQMTQPCKDAKIENFPTWIFADGTRSVGVQRPDVLAEKAGCAMPSSEEAGA